MSFIFRQTRLERFLGSLKPEHIATAYIENTEKVRVSVAASTAVLFTAHAMTGRLEKLYRSMGVSLPGLISRIRRFPYDVIAAEMTAYCHGILLAKIVESKADAEFTKAIGSSVQLTARELMERTDGIPEGIIVDRASSYCSDFIAEPQRALDEVVRNLAFAISDRRIRLKDEPAKNRSVQILASIKTSLGIDHQSVIPGLVQIVKDIRQLDPEFGPRPEDAA